MTTEELDELAYRRWSEAGDHQSERAALAAWNAAAAFVRAHAGQAFVDRKEEEARSLRDLADVIAAQGKAECEPRIAAALERSVEAERDHIAELERTEGPGHE